MQRVDFFGLERPIQERFVAAARASAPPFPLAVIRARTPPAVLAWLAFAALACVGIAVVARSGYADLQSRYALQTTRALPLYAGLGACAGLALLLAFMIQRARSALPFSLGVYLFPSGVIDARELGFGVYKLAELAAITRSERSLTLTFESGARFRFSLQSQDRAQEIERTLHELKERLGPDVAPVSARELSVWDPLCDNGFSNPFSPRERMRVPRTRLFSAYWFLALALGAGLGALVWKLRTHLAEAALYAAARRENTRTAYQAYVDRGGANRDVREVLLPRTELAEIVRRHSIAELDRFKAAHPSSRIDAEIENALHVELSGTLAAARSTGTLAALKDFRARFADQPSIRAELDAAINERLTAALREFERRARPKPEVFDLFRRLLAYAAEHDGRVKLRFRRRIPDSVAKAEELLAKSLYFGGKPSLPAQYFDAAHAATREEPVGKEIVSTLARGFSEDILSFELAPPLEDAGDEEPRVTEPTIVVTHRTEMSGAYLMRKPRAALTGIGVLFRISFQIPDKPPSFTYKYSVWSAPDLKSMMNGESFEAIYDEMADRAFAKLARKYLTELVPGLVTSKSP